MTLETKLVTRLFVLVFVFLMALPHLDVAFAADIVTVPGYVRDTDGNPIRGITVEAFSPTPPWTLCGQVTTDAGGRYALSLDRSKRQPHFDSLGV